MRILRAVCDLGKARVTKVPKNKMLTLLAILIVSGPATAATVPTPTEAVNWAIAHQASTVEQERPFKRYVWIPPTLAQIDEQHDERHIAGVVNYAVNLSLSQAGLVIRPQVIANGWMLVYDLRELAPDDDDFQRIATFLERLALDEPYFHETKENAGGQVAAIAKHIKQPHGEILVQLNLSAAMVLRADWLIVELLGDRYYDAAGWVKADGSLFTQAEVYATFGVDEAKSKQLNGDQRVAITISGVTGSVRRVDRIQGIGGRHNSGSVWQTYDTIQPQGAVRQNPLYNLLKFVPDGGEAIIEKQNGLHAFIIYDARRNIVRAADANLVTDYTIPSGNPQILTPAIGCIRCHSDSQGLKPAPNHVKQLVESGTDIIGDVSGGRDVLDRLAGLYMGDFTKRLRRGREDYEEAIRRCTIHRDFPQGMGAIETSDLTAAVFDAYKYGQVSAAVAVQELGYIPGDDAVATLNNILPRSEFPNPMIGLLRAGIGIRRVDWEQIYSAARLSVIEGQNG